MPTGARGEHEWGGASDAAGGPCRRRGEHEWGGASAAVRLAWPSQEEPGVRALALEVLGYDLDLDNLD